MTSCLRTVIGGLFLVLAVPLCADEHPQPIQDAKPLLRFEFLQIRMAIPVRITVYAADEATANQASNRAYRRFKELDRLLSDYDPNSELSRLCSTAQPGVAIPVSHELFTVLSHAQTVSEQTDGAFDVTVGPLTDLWRKVRRRRVLPADDERSAALSHVGWRHIKLCDEERTVTLGLNEMRLDLGGIAKGYAADEALRVMAEAGVTRALVDAGGDIVAGDPPPGSDGWSIGIAPLDAPRGTPDRFLKLCNAAVATSGDASQHVEIDGVRYSHIVDPKTGMGVTAQSSVTVIAADGISADSLASALSVLGPQKGIAVIEATADAEAFIVTRDSDGQVSTHTSSGFSSDIDRGPSLPVQDNP